MAISEDGFAKVLETLVDALGVDDDEVTPEATLVEDLGAESIDFLDIVFRLEKAFGIKIEQSELRQQPAGPLATDVQLPTHLVDRPGPQHDPLHLVERDAVREVDPVRERRSGVGSRLLAVPCPVPFVGPVGVVRVRGRPVADSAESSAPSGAFDRGTWIPCLIMFRRTVCGVTSVPRASVISANEPYDS